MSSKPDHSDPQLIPTDRTTLKRKPERGTYDKETLYSILDEGLIAHVGFSIGDRPIVIPMTYARMGDTVLLHGSPAARFFRELGKGCEICLSVTLLDGIVLARSVFHHSLNYRSGVLFGVPEEITDPEKKREALKVITEHLAPNRWDEARKPTDQEIRATSIFSLTISEGSAKVRKGPPIDLEEDMNFPVWAGWIPLHTRFGEPIPDEGISDDRTLPAILKSKWFSSKS